MNNTTVDESGWEYYAARFHKINELENMKINVQYNQSLNKVNKVEKINTQHNAVAAIRAGSFIVGSIDTNGNLSFAANPAVHATPQAARAEARRLATLNVGKIFVISKLYGAEFVQAAPTLSI